jgi:GTP-sensing pleiotropic transcriptional regulator CodY
MVNNSTNINKTTESLSIYCQQFNQYQQNNRKIKQPWTTIQPISTKQKKDYTTIVNNSTNNNKTKASLSSHGQQFNQYQQNKRKFKQPWSTIQPISTKQQKV